MGGLLRAALIGGDAREGEGRREPFARPSRRGPAASLRAHLDVFPRRIAERRQPAAAGLARRDLFWSLRSDPRGPVDPPGARVFLGRFQPGVELAARLPARPILVLRFVGGIDDA